MQGYLVVKVCSVKRMALRLLAQIMAFYYTFTPLQESSLLAGSEIAPYSLSYLISCLYYLVKICMKLGNAIIDLIVNLLSMHMFLLSFQFQANYYSLPNYILTKIDLLLDILM